MRNRVKASAIVFAAMIFGISMPGCSASRKELKSRTVFAMDTYINVSIQTDDEEIFSEIESAIREADGRLSVTDQESEIFRLNRDKELTVSDSTAQVIGRALELCAETEGALDISIYPIVKLWGFTTGKYVVPDDIEINETLKNVGYKRVSLDGNRVSLDDKMSIDLGSVGKGYMGDAIAEIIKARGADSGMIDLGGNIRTIGRKADGSRWKVAVRSPDGTGIIGIISSEDESVVTSGGYERYFVDDHGNTRWHIFDPATGRPAQKDIISVTVIGKDGMRCDALSTALFTMGKDKAVEFWNGKRDFDMIIVTNGNEAYITPDLSKRFDSNTEDIRFYVIGED